MKKVLLGIGYWILQLTWGILMTFIGFFVTMFCLIFLKGKIHRNGYGFITEVKGNWGGVSLGAFALCGSYNQPNGPCYDPDWYDHTRKHEFGHSIQNLFMGPFFPFIVAIPSAIRYWLDMYGKLKSEYDSVWFEHTATAWGTKAIEKIELTNKQK